MRWPAGKSGASPRESGMATVSWGQVLVAVGGIALVFGVFAFLLIRARRTHTRRFGGISYWEVLGGRRLRLRRRRKQR